MTESFRALRVHNEDGKIFNRIESLTLDQLGAGDITIKAAYSSINYKDALGATGTGKIQRKFPLVAGIDVSGTVLESNDSNIPIGSDVLVTGCGLGEVHDGGYSQIVRVPKEWVITIPKGLSTRDAMIYGTAGFTAGLCVHRLLQNGQTPAMGPIVVTGATGGVGSLAIPLLKKRGFQVIAVSGKLDRQEYLKNLGADQVLPLEELQLGQRPLESVKFGGAIDNLGGAALEGLMRHVELWGNIAVVGLAMDHKFSNTVMPLILRGVSLLGISSNNCPLELRKKIWADLAGELKPDHLQELVTNELGLDEMNDAFHRMLDRKTYGRILIKL